MRPALAQGRAHARGSGCLSSSSADLLCRSAPPDGYHPDGGALACLSRRSHRERLERALTRPALRLRDLTRVTQHVHHRGRVKLTETRIGVHHVRKRGRRHKVTLTGETLAPHRLVTWHREQVKLI